MKYAIGMFLKCTFEVLLVSPAGFSVADQVDFLCEVKHYEPGTFNDLPHHILDCSEDRTHQMLTFVEPTPRQWIVYEGDGRECR